MNQTQVEDAPVLIIGAGPYGIAAAQELWRCGLEPVVFGEPFATWHRHTLDLMDLRSDPRGSSVWSPDGRYDFPRFLHQAHTSAGHRIDHEVVPVSLYRQYLQAVEGALPFRLVRALVHELELTEDGYFQARSRPTPTGNSSGEAIGDEIVFRARAVVVATGPGAHRHLPAAFDDLPADRLLHSWDVDEIQRLDGRRILVVGGGQSAAEAVASLCGRNQVTWALRRPPLFFREPLRVPTPLFKLMLAGSNWLFRLPPPILRAISQATFRTTITPRLSAIWNDPKVDKLICDAEGLGLTMRNAGLSGGGEGVASQDDSEMIQCAADGRDYDVIVSATGFRFSLAGLPFLSPSLLARLSEAGDPPPIRADFSSRVPGLYLAGGIAESTHGPAMRFVLGARHAAKTLGRALPQWLESTDARAAA